MATFSSFLVVPKMRSAASANSRIVTTVETGANLTPTCQSAEPSSALDGSETSPAPLILRRRRCKCLRTYYLGHRLAHPKSVQAVILLAWYFVAGKTSNNHAF